MQNQYLRRITVSLVVIGATVWVAMLMMGASAAPTGGTASGAAVYSQQCSKCHGADGKGIKSLSPPDFTNHKWQAAQSDKDLVDSISNGKGIMPGYKSSLSSKQIAALVRQVRSFSRK